MSRAATAEEEALPGYPEIDFAEHCGGAKIDGDFVHSFVMTDTATGWAECLGMPCRSALVLEHVEKFAKPYRFGCVVWTATTIALS